jgi:hypothetical protein
MSALCRARFARCCKEAGPTREHAPYARACSLLARVHVVQTLVQPCQDIPMGMFNLSRWTVPPPVSGQTVHYVQLSGLIVVTSVHTGQHEPTSIHMCASCPIHEHATQIWTSWAQPCPAMSCYVHIMLTSRTSGTCLPKLVQSDPHALTGRGGEGSETPHKFAMKLATHRVMEPGWSDYSPK